MISVVMASFLGDYPRAATNRIEKFHRAIHSFLIQHIGELIIVSDGCDVTNAITKEYQNNHSNIVLIELEKQSLFSGKVRQAGIAKAQYEWICYLDTDDRFLPGHLYSIVNQVQDISTDIDWVYYDEFVDYPETVRRTTAVAYSKLGTSSIAHRQRILAIWPDGYCHDWKFIQQLGHRYKKIVNTGYLICHVPGLLDT